MLSYWLLPSGIYYITIRVEPWIKELGLIK